MSGQNEAIPFLDISFIGGMRILFISRKRPNFDIVPFIKSQANSLIDQGMDVEHFIIDVGGIKGYIRSISKLKKYLKDKKFDVIHGHYSYCGWVGLLAARKTPVVVSFMGADVYGSKGLEGNKRLRSFIDILIAKALEFFVQAIIVKSENLYNYVYLKNKVELVPNGVDFDKFKPRDKNQIREKLNIDPDKKVILFLGHPTYVRKNFTLLKQAVAIAAEPSWHILNPYPTEPENIPYYINSADVIALTSLQEGSPNVIKEAMASNCPVVSTDVGDVKEVINGTPGCYLAKYDAHDFANKLRKALEFDNGTTGRKDIEHLEISTIAKKIIGIYSRLINGPIPISS
ncbi:glycosyltransferase family 4 protein [Fulvivirgaceae bacterium BMA10]|uniref:Glycosyltransferase family 4 protein n=1 Tax=Splendidivirga corallicola TaxID=3051826 RepID=A0ABT8KQW3_9BACT|nr:glycosyltransferase family 4 protein [Fulvivirgaceae bacterium BMA10]